MKKLVFFVLLCVTFGCSKSTDSGVTWNQLESAPWDNVSKESLPEILVVKINEIESRNLFGKVKIFRGEWRRSVVYYIRDPHASCGFCEVYYQDGKNIEWSVEDASSDSFVKESKNWVLIFESGKGLF